MNKPNTFRLSADILMIAFLVAFPHAGLLPMYAYPVVALLILWLYLRLMGERFSSINFRFSDLTLKSFLLGGIIGVGYAALQYFAIGPLIDSIFHFKRVDFHDFDFIKQSVRAYLMLLLLAAVLVIPYEEIIFRGFIFTKIKNMARLSGQAFVISAVITSVIFALYHYQEGPGAALSIFIGALFTMWLYKLFNFNLWYLIFYHITYDIVMLTAIRYGYL
ncbi:MAG: CPBP family intramembrane glutamic endopeptidase [Mucilaginibacter sp.]